MERLMSPVPLRLRLRLKDEGNRAEPLGGGSAPARLSTLQVNFLGLWRLGAAFLFALTLIVALPPHADAAFIGNYSVPNSVINNNADGFVTTPDNGQSLVLTGGNNGSGLPGTTDVLFTAAASGAVQFRYAYSALDFPGLDYAGYLLGNNFTQLADSDGSSGTGLFTVSSGQRFGFRVGTLDNTGEPGILTVSDFSAPSGGSAVPEPGTAPILFMAAAAFAAVRLRKAASCVEE